MPAIDNDERIRLSIMFAEHACHNLEGVEQDHPTLKDHPNYRLAVRQINSAAACAREALNEYRRGR